MSCRTFYPDCCWVAKSHNRHAAVHLPVSSDLQLWPFALQHAIYLRNILPDPSTKLFLLEVILGSNVPEYSHLQCLCVCSSPTFILDLMDRCLLNSFLVLVWVVSWVILLFTRLLLVSFSTCRLDLFTCITICSGINLFKLRRRKFFRRLIKFDL